jgi:alpha-ketoglutarate-dependent taurine dioxygenase
MSTEEPTRTIGGLRGARRQAVDTTRLIDTSFVEGNEDSMPLVITPAVENVALADWCASNKAELDGYFDRYGAILFRGFPLHEAADFEAVASAIAPDLFAEYGDLPPEGASERIYGSTPYPADKMILFHNESSHLPSWPTRQFFFCVIPAQERGETPLLDCRKVCDALGPELLEEFAQKGLMYVRNFSAGVDVPWQDFFHTSDKAEVEQTCSEAGMSCEWTANDGLRIRQVSPAVVNHPRTGERIFFNQIQLHHFSCLDPETQTALRQLFAEEDLPRNVYFGDGTPIPDEVVARIGEIYEDLCVEFPWQAGDLIAVDNMLVAHARRPFVGPRKLLVAMGAMVTADELKAAATG